MKKTILAALALVCALVSASAAPGGTNPKPFVVPDVRQWQGSKGVLNITTSSRIVVADPALRAVADSLAADWQRMFGTALEVVSGKAAASDVELKIKADRRLGDEGYTMTADSRLTISSPTPTGVYWGTRTLLQIAQQTPGQAVPKGKITDWPDYPVRGLSLDVGRKFFPLDYVDDLVKVLSYYKLNSLRLHLNDNGFPYYFANDWDKTYAAFRMESDTFPGLTSRDGYYTKQQMRDLQRTSAGDMVEIVPEIDIPAHALAFARYRGIGSKEFGEDHLDLFNPATMPFLDSLFHEYLGGPDPVFTGRYMHIGTDEFGKDYPGFDKQKETAERFRAFMDHYIRLVEGYGKTPWVWGSLSTAPGETPVKTQGVMLDAWYNGYADPKEMARLGFKINSIPDGMVYIVPNAGYYHDYLNTEWLYKEWTPARVGSVQFEERDTALVGGYFAVWNDHVGNGVSVQDVHHRVMDALPVMAAKLWDGPSVTLPYDDFRAASQQLAEAPGVNRLARVGDPQSVVYEAAQLRPGQSTGISDVGYDWTLEFTLDATPEKPGTVLFESPDAKLYLADPVKGMLGFMRDGYLYDFGFRPYPGEKVDIRITGTNKATRLYVDGKLFCSLDNTTEWYNEGKNKMYRLQTLVLPLAKAGQFESKVSDLKVSNYIR